MAAKCKPNKSVGSFEVAPLNFETSEYIDLINWNKCKLIEPPVFRDYLTTAIHQIFHGFICQNYHRSRINCIGI